MKAIVTGVTGRGKAMPARELLPDKVCEFCGKVFNRNRLRGGRLEGKEDYEKRKCCSDIANLELTNHSEHRKHHVVEQSRDSQGRFK